MSDMPMRDSDVRFRGQSGYLLGLAECLLVTQGGHSVPSVSRLLGKGTARINTGFD